MSYFEEIRKRGRVVNPFFVMMGIDVDSFGEGTARLSMRVRPDMHNGVGWMQGGIFTAMADEAMALALYSVVLPGEGIATISETTSFLKGARKDDLLVATGRVVRKGRRVAFTESEVRRDSDAGEVLARCAAAFAIVEKPDPASSGHGSRKKR
ncbi:MAG TPA: PaaI family thioesterase [Methanomicrobiales archaeon]|nr:PaaI family thioesterase [Methanomicrobiales archaeon]